VPVSLPQSSSSEEVRCEQSRIDRGLAWIYLVLRSGKIGQAYAAAGANYQLRDLSRKKCDKPRELGYVSAPAWAARLKGCSSIGRASVSKTEGWGFETLRPCQVLGGLVLGSIRGANLRAVNQINKQGAVSKARLLDREPSVKNPLHFIQEVRQEVSKVTWPTWKEVWITTAMVLVMVALTSVFFLLTDMVIGALVRFILRLGQ
jgi:preprotein translocase subunit SecE